MWSVHQVVDQMSTWSCYNNSTLSLCWVCDTLHGRATARSVSRPVRTTHTSYSSTLHQQSYNLPGKISG